jgi:hypothetical protein
LNAKQLLKLFERELFDVEYVHANSENALTFFAHHRFEQDRYASGICFEIGPDVNEAKILSTPNKSSDIEAEIRAIKASVAVAAVAIL